MIRALSILAVVIVLLTSCASPYIGSSVNMEAEGVCHSNSFPASCAWTTQNFRINYTIDQTNEENIYNITGTASAIDGDSKTFTNFSGASFTLYLVSNRYIVDTFQTAAGSGSLGRTIKFSRNFEYPLNFDAVLLSYHMKVKG